MKEDIVFSVKSQEGTADVSAEEVLVSLLNKVGSIAEIHHLSVSLAYISVPTFWSQSSRFALQRSAEISLGKPVRLVDEWASLASHYAYTRMKELKQLH